MASFCQVVLVGNLGKDPEERSIPSGKRVVTFSVAVQDGYGEQARTVWVRVTAWEKTGETAMRFLKKGNPVLVSGRLSPIQEWEKDGKKHNGGYEVTAEKLTLLGSGERQDSAPQERRGFSPPPQSGGSGGSIDDDLPF